MHQITTHISSSTKTWFMSGLCLRPPCGTATVKHKGIKTEHSQYSSKYTLKGLLACCCIPSSREFTF